MVFLFLLFLPPEKKRVMSIGPTLPWSTVFHISWGAVFSICLWWCCSLSYFFLEESMSSPSYGWWCSFPFITSKPSSVPCLDKMKIRWKRQLPSLPLSVSLFSLWVVVHFLLRVVFPLIGVVEFLSNGKEEELQASNTSPFEAVVVSDPLQKTRNKPND